MREAKWAQRPPHAYAGACIPQHQAGLGRQVLQQQRAGRCGSSVLMGGVGAAFMRYGARLGKVGGEGSVHVSLPFVACIQGNASPVPFPATCRGSMSDTWVESRRGSLDRRHVQTWALVFPLINYSWPSNLGPTYRCSIFHHTTCPSLVPYRFLVSHQRSRNKALVACSFKVAVVN
jgi:hypothetical protein